MLTFNSIFCICYIACWSLRQALSFIVLENLNISKSINVFAFLTRVNSEKTEWSEHWSNLWRLNSMSSFDVVTGAQARNQGFS